MQIYKVHIYLESTNLQSANLKLAIMQMQNAELSLASAAAERV